MKAIIIGGGIVGLNVALSLQARGYEATVIEPSGLSVAASYGNAGHIATEQVEPLASYAMVASVLKRLYINGGALDLPLSGMRDWLPFSLRLLRAAHPKRFAQGKAALSGLMAEALPAWQRRVADVGVPDLLREDGHYIVWESPETAERGRKVWAQADTGTATPVEVTADEMAVLSTLTLKPLAGAIRFKGTAQVSDPQRVLKILSDTLRQRGGRLVQAKAVSIGQQASGLEIQLESGEALMADCCVVCAGVWSKPLLEAHGLKVPIIAERGYHIQTQKHGWPKGLAPVVFEDRSTIATAFESGLRVASFVELTHPDAAPDASKWNRLRHHVQALGLPFEGRGDEWSGMRPTLPDYLPAIGAVKDVPGLYYAFGHQHLGLTLGPVTGERVSRMVAGEEAPEAFSLKRFQ